MKKQTTKQTKKKETKNSPKNNLDLSQFTFLHDYLLVQAIREESVNGLVKPEQYDDKPELGVVIKVGPGRVLESGEIAAPGVKEGDTIFFGKYSSEQTRSLGNDYYIIRAEDVRAVK